MSDTAPGPTPPLLDDADVAALQALLEAVPAPFDALDISSLDGFLCGVIVQPRPVPVARWFPFVTDVDGRPLPAGFDAAPLRALVLRRHDELSRAIASRRWFDPWIFAEEGDDEGADDGEEPGVDAVYPWVAGIATALEQFPGAMSLPPESTLEPLALLYRHLDADDLEDADALLEEIESMEPPTDLTEAVEGLVRATLLLADAAQPEPSRKAADAVRKRAAARRRR